MSTARSKVLFIVTSHDRLGDTAERTGIWTEELAAPYYRLIDAGVYVNLASPRGGKAPLDPASVKVSARNPASVERFVHDPEAMRLIATTRKVEAVDFGVYAAVLFPGGRGTMWDLPGNAAIADKLGKFFDSGRAVAAVGHGPAGLVGARSKHGKPIVEGRRISAFTDAEEEIAGLTRVVPFLLESRLRDSRRALRKSAETSAFRSARRKSHHRAEPDVVRARRPASARGPRDRGGSCCLTLSGTDSARRS